MATLEEIAAQCNEGDVVDVSPDGSWNVVSRGGQNSFTCDIFIKTYMGDAGFIGYCLRSIDKFATGFRNVVILVPRGDWRPALPLSRGTLHEVDEQGDGYLWQQVCKLKAHEYTDADYILYLDSDTIFNQPVTPETYFEGGKPLWLMTPWEKTETPWQPIVEKFLGQPVAFEFMRRHPQMVPRWLLDEIGVFCLRVHGMPIEQYVMSRPNRDFSEFNCMGAYAYQFHRDKFLWLNTEATRHLPPLTVRQEFSWGGLNDTIRANFEAILNAPDGLTVNPEWLDAPLTSAACLPTSEPESAATPWTSPLASITEIRRLASELQKFCTGGARTQKVREELHHLGIIELKYRYKRRKGWKKKRA